MVSGNVLDAGQYDVYLSIRRTLFSPQELSPPSIVCLTSTPRGFQCFRSKLDSDTKRFGCDCTVTQEDEVRSTNARPPSTSSATRAMQELTVLGKGQGVGAIAPTPFSLLCLRPLPLHLPLRCSPYTTGSERASQEKGTESGLRSLESCTAR